MKKTGLNNEQVKYFSKSSIFLNNRTATFNDTYAMLEDAKQSTFGKSFNQSQNIKINSYYFFCYFLNILIITFNNNNFKIQFVNI